MPTPDVTVAVPTHQRAERLRALLDGLERQTLPRVRFEVVVCHTADGATERLLETHPLARDGTVRPLPLAPGERGPSLQRNRSWRAATAPIVAFIDDDCRPEPRWLEQLVRTADESPGAIVEGRTRPDPEEEHQLAGPFARSLDIDPPSRWAPTCNILYPRELLERLGGFDETFPAAAGEDTDMMLRAVELGARHIGAREALVWHAVDPGSLLKRLRSLPRWQHLVLVVRRHPEARQWLTYSVFWKPSHARLVPALAGLALAGATRKPGWLALALPWLWLQAPRYGTGPRAVAASARDTAAQLVLDTGELAVMARGSLRYRTLML